MSDDVTRQVLDDVEGERHSAEIALEQGLSVNDWIKRIQGAAIQAQRAARSGSHEATYRSWVELAGIAIGAATAQMIRWVQVEPEGAQILQPTGAPKDRISPDHSLVTQYTGTEECFRSIINQMPTTVTVALLPTGQLLAAVEGTGENVLVEPTEWLYYDGVRKEVGVRKELTLGNGGTSE